MRTTFVIGLLLIVSCIAAYTDVKKTKIYNWLTLPMMASGLIYTIIFREDVLWKIIAILVFLLPTFFGMAKGDHKFITGLLLWNFWYGLTSFIMGNMVALIYIIKIFIDKTKAPEMLLEKNYVKYFVDTYGKMKIPMAAFFLCGSLIYIVYYFVGGFFL